MKAVKKLLPGILLIAVFMIQMLSSSGPTSIPSTIPNADGTEPFQTIDGHEMENAPTSIHEFALSDQGLIEWDGISSGLDGNEYGNKSDEFTDRQLRYLTSNTTTEETLSIPVSPGWETYEVQAEVSGLTENRTWLTNDDFDDSSDWSYQTYNAIPAPPADDSGSTRTSEWRSYAGGSTYFAQTGYWYDDVVMNQDGWWYDVGDKEYAVQNITVPRGEVEWVGVSLDYWADNLGWGLMTGFFELFVSVGDPDNGGTYLWSEQFDAIPSSGVWYSTGLVELEPSALQLPNVSIWIGLRVTQREWYLSSDIRPTGRMDDIRIYMKTKATPEDVNLEMNGEAISNGPTNGTGSIVQTPATPWQTDPVLLNLTWSPNPTNPDPNREIRVDFDISTNLFARKIDARTVTEINPSSYGEIFTVLNNSDVTYTSYFYASIPTGYIDRYFFNVSLPANRDVTFVARPISPTINLTSGWSGGDPGDLYLNVSAYEAASEAGRLGYWRTRSSSPNMITDIQLFDPNNGIWSRNVDLRAGNVSMIQVFVGADYVDSFVNMSIYDPTGSKWDTVNAIVNATGYAETGTFSFDGANASAGSWLVEATTTDIGTNGTWTSTGFFRRGFSVTHESNIVLTHPEEAVGTWMANVTFGDLLLIIVKVNDTDSNFLVPQGTLEMNWALGKDVFDDSGNGEYTKVVDTSQLAGKGQYVIDLEWSLGYFDNSTAQLTLNVNYATTLTSPDYPGISGPIGTNQTFQLSFSNVNGTGIIDATVICNWTGPYSVKNLGLGLYSIELDTTGVVIGRYPVLVNASGTFVESASMLMYVDVREVYNTISYSANELSIPVGENASFTVIWIDTDSGDPIQGGAGFIVCNWTPFHSSGDQNYTVTEVSPGEYEVIIITKSDDPLTADGEFINVRFMVNRTNYLNHTFDIRVSIRSHNTLFILDEPVEQTPYGDTIIVLVHYLDTDLDQGIVNDTFEVRLTLSSPSIGSLQYTTSASGLGNGHYNITLSSSQWGTIGWKNLTLFIEWTGAVVKYYNQTIETRVRVLGTETSLSLGLAPSATVYLDEFTFSVIFWDEINSTRISNSSGPSPNNVFLTITPITLGHPVTQADFLIAESVVSPGTYDFVLNSSLFLATGTFRFEFAFMWSSGTGPFYENQTMTVTLVVLERPTYIDYSPVQATPYGETAEFAFNFVDTRSIGRIENTSSLIVSLNEMGVSFTLSYNDSTRTFTMLIDTATLGGIGAIPLHLNMTWVGPPFYQSIVSHEFTVIVSLRSTQLTHLQFAPGQWGNNVTIEFVYTDLVSGSPIGMTGQLTLNGSLSGWYSVSSLGDGRYLVVLNTSGFIQTGVYALNATITYTGANNAADASEVFGFVVLNRVTQFGYDSPDVAPYLSNVTFTVSYLDDTTGTGIDGANISVTCSNSSQSLVLDSNYWVVGIGDGLYSIHVSTTALGSVSAFVLNVTVTWDNEPFYLPVSRLVNSRVAERTTQIVVTQTPGETPFLDNVTFLFRFEDYLAGSNIPIGKTHISLNFGGTYTPILASEYALHDYGTYYEISFNSTTLNPSALVDSVVIRLLIDSSSGPPFYAVRNITTLATTVERPTQILFTSIEETTYFDNVTIFLEYVDFLTGRGIENALVTLDVLNSSTPTYYVTEIGEGEYVVYMPSAQFGKPGLLLFNLTLSKSGVPFYSLRATIDVPATVRTIQTSILASTPAPAAIPVGELVVVNITFIDFDHSTPISGATVTTDWTSRHGTEALVFERANGLYQIEINTTGLIAKQYSFTVQAEKLLYATGNITVIIQPGSSAVEINLERTAYFADWGDIVRIRFTVEDPVRGTLVPEMNATLLWNGSLHSFTDLDNGTYELYLDSAEMDFGVFNPQISVSRQYYQTRQRSFTLIVSKANGQTSPEQSSFNVVLETSLQFYVYLNDTTRNQPITGASVIMDWNNTPYAFTFNGTPGYYEVVLDVTGFDIGQYEAEIVTIALNFIIIEVTVDIYIAPIPTSLSESSGLTQFTVYFGEIIHMNFEYNDTFYTGRIPGANLTYSIGDLFGILQEQPNGTYSMTIDTRYLRAGTLFLRLTGSKTNYSISSRSFVFSVLYIPTQLSVDQPTEEGFARNLVSFIFFFNDTRNYEPIIGATITVEWEGGTNATIVEIGGGYYNVTIDIGDALPKLYDIVVRAYIGNYLGASLRTNIVVRRTPALITGRTGASIPVNEAGLFLFNVVNSLTNDTISDVVGYADWDIFGPVELELMANDSYALIIPDDLTIGEYTIQIRFETAKYSLLPSFLTFELGIRPIDTRLNYAFDSTVALANGFANFTILFFDEYHGVGISDAEIRVTGDTSTFSWTNNATYNDIDGYYSLYFTTLVQETVNITVTFQKENYETQVHVFKIEYDISGQQVLTQTFQIIGGIAFIGIAAAVIAYVRIFSIPKSIRVLNKMLKALGKMKVPAPYPSPTRADIILLMANEELSPVSLVKTIEDVTSETVVAVVPEVDALLDRLAEITGLEDAEIDAFRQDLARMKASERPGFLMEVIKQEEARRADALAGIEAEEIPIEEKRDVLGDQPEELDDLRRKLVKKGLGEDEIDVILEQAKALSRADLEALLSSLGLELD